MEYKCKRADRKRAWYAAILLFALCLLLSPIRARAEEIQDYRIPEDDPGVVQMAKASSLPAGKLRVKKGRTRYITKKKKALKNAWICVKGKVYCLDAHGYARTGKYTYKNYTYFFDRKGVMAVKRLVSIGHRQYYCSKTGAMIRDGWKRIGGNWYYFRHDGSMAENMWVGSWYVGSEGCLDMDLGQKKIRTETFSASKKSRLIIVGASRVVQMARAVHTDKDVIYIASSGKGLRWFLKTGLPKLRHYLKKYPKSSVVIQLGNNDIKKKRPDGDINAYIKEYEKLMKKWPRARFFLMDALPGASPEGDEKNRLREKFNQALAEAFPGQYIGGYDFMVSTGFVCSYNKNHYSDNTSRKIYNYILEHVRQ